MNALEIERRIGLTVSAYALFGSIIGTMLGSAIGGVISKMRNSHDRIAFMAGAIIDGFPTGLASAIGFAFAGLIPCLVCGETGEKGQQQATWCELLHLTAVCIASLLAIVVALIFASESSPVSRIRPPNLWIGALFLCVTLIVAKLIAPYAAGLTGSFFGNKMAEQVSDFTVLSGIALAIAWLIAVKWMSYQRPVLPSTTADKVGGV